MGRSDFDHRLARFQTWLQGHGYPPPRRPWIAWKLGNLISDVRYLWWRLTEGRDA